MAKKAGSILGSTVSCKLDQTRGQKYKFFFTQKHLREGREIILKGSWTHRVVGVRT